MPRLAAVLLVAAAPAAAPVETLPAAYGESFVSAFADACVPGRLSYEGSREAATAAGWTETARDAHPELAAMMDIAESAALDTDLTDPTFDATIYAKSVADTPHYLVVSRASSIIGERSDPLNPWAFVGCYLYNFDATAPIDPAPVTALIGKPISHSVTQDGVISHVWGPPCPMPRTGDTYLTFIAEGSPMVSSTAFSGTVLKFSTSEPDPGTPPPAPYC